MNLKTKSVRVEHLSSFSRWWIWKLRKFIRVVRCTECGSTCPLKGWPNLDTETIKAYWYWWHNQHKEC